MAVRSIELCAGVGMLGEGLRAGLAYLGHPSCVVFYPYLDPALEPDFRSVVDGLAFGMDDSRAPRLKCIGNGVVALQAAVAAVVLALRAGIRRQ